MATKKTDAASTPAPAPVVYTVPATDQSKNYAKFGPIAPLDGDQWPILIGRGGLVYIHKSLDVANGKNLTITITSA